MVTVFTVLPNAENVAGPAASVLTTAGGVELDPPQPASVEASKTSATLPVTTTVRPKFFLFTPSELIDLLNRVQVKERVYRFDWLDGDPKPDSVLAKCCQARDRAVERGILLGKAEADGFLLCWRGVKRAHRYRRHAQLTR